MDPHRIKVVLRHPLTLLGGVLLAAYALGAVVLNVVVDTDALRDWLAPRASAVLNRPVSLGDARVALLPRPSIHVGDVRIDNLPNFEGPVLVSADRVRLDVAWLPLLVGRVRVRNVQVDGPRFYLAIDEHGSSNYGDLAPDWSGTGPSPASPVSFDFDRVVVSDASLSYFDAPAARSFTISGADVTATVQPDSGVGWRAELAAHSDSLQVRLASVTEEIVRVAGPTASLTLQGDGTGRSVDVTSGYVELAGQSLTVRGRAAGLEGTHPTYDIQVSNQALDADVLAAAIPGSVRSDLLPHLDGTLGVTFQVTGARVGGYGPLVRGSVRLDDVAVHVGGNLMLDHVHGVVGVAPDSIVLDSVAGMFADGPFELSGVVARESRTLALMASAHPDLDALDRLELVPRGATLSGDAALDVSLAGRIDALDTVTVAGTVTLTGAQAKYTTLGVPLYVPAGRLTLAGRDVSWSDLVVLVGEDRVVTSGTLTNLLSLTGQETKPGMEVSIRGPHLDLGAIVPERPEAPQVGYPLVAFAHLGGRSLDGRGPAAILTEWGMSRPTRLPAGGTVRIEIDTLDFRSRHLESVVANLELSDSALVIDAPSFRVWGDGSAEGLLRLGVGPSREEPFSLSLRVEDAAAGPLMAALTPVGTAVSGRAALEVHADGLTDPSLLPVGRDLSGTVRLQIEDGHVAGTGPNLVIADFLGSDAWTDVAFTTWDTEIVVDDSRLEVRSSDLEGPEARASLAGLVLFDGSHDLSVGLSIPPEQLANVSLRRTGIAQSVLERLADSGSRLDIGLRMSGLLWAPTLEPDASSAVAYTR